MLYISGFENESARIKEVNLFQNNGHPFALIDVNDYKNFPDAFPRFLYVGTFAHFDTKNFLLFLSENVKWEFPEYNQLFIQEEDDYTLKVYTHSGKTLALDSYKESD